MTTVEEASKRKTRANTKVRVLTRLLAEAEEEFQEASLELKRVKETV